MTTRLDAQRGFTLIEMMIALVMGLVILAASLSFAVSTMRTVEVNEARGAVYRNARFVQMSLERDLQLTGVGIASTPSWGALSVFDDTLVILTIPYEPDEASPYDLNPPPGTDNPLPAGGTCGANCLDLLPDANGQFDIKPGDFARLQVLDTRRALYVTSVSPAGGGGARVEFSNAPTILRYPSGLSGGLLLDRFSTFVQKVRPIIYYTVGDTLMRAERLKADRSPDGHVVAYGVSSWDVRVIFTDGDEADAPNGADTDYTNDFDDVVSLRITVELGADNPRPGEADFIRRYEWRFSPRNLMYERNRL